MSELKIEAAENDDDDDVQDHSLKPTKTVYFSSIDKWSKMGEGMNAYISYELTSQKIIDGNTTTYKTSRRFRNFLTLHERLVETYQCQGYLLPPAPEKDFISNTKVILKITKDDFTYAQFVERRRSILERYLNRIGQHSVLNKDPNYLEFIQSKNEYDHCIRSNDNQSSSASKELNNTKSSKSKHLTSTRVIGRAFGIMAETLSKIRNQSSSSSSAKEDATDQYFKSLLSYANEHLNAYKDLSKALSNMASGRKAHEMLAQTYCYSHFSFIFQKPKEFVSTIQSFAIALQIQSNAEQNTLVCHGLTFASDAIKRLKEENVKLWDVEQLILTECAKDYAGYFENIKAILCERETLRLAMLDAEKKQKQNSYQSGLEAAQLSTSTYKNNNNNEHDEDEGKLYENNLQTRFEQISRNIREELKQFQKQKFDDFQSAIVTYVDAYKTYFEQVSPYFCVMQSLMGEREIDDERMERFFNAYQKIIQKQ